MAYWVIQCAIALVLLITTLVSNKIQLDIYGANYFLHALIKAAAFIALTHFLIRKTIKSNFYARKSKLTAVTLVSCAIISAAVIEHGVNFASKNLLIDEQVKQAYIDENGDPWQKKKEALEKEICADAQSDEVDLANCVTKDSNSVSAGYQVGFQLGHEFAKEKDNYKQLKRFIVTSIFFLAWALFYILIVSTRNKRYKSSPIAYVSVQLLLSFFILGTSLSIFGIAHKPNMGIVAIALFNVVITLVFTHMVFRKVIHFMRKQEMGVGMYIAALVPLLVLVVYADFNIRLLIETKLTSLMTPLDVTLEAIPEGSSLARTAAFYVLWMVAYFPLSTLNNRMQIKRRLKSGQLSLLISQLNPHFLFNALNSLRGMIYENKELANDLVDKLTELFKYSLNTTNQFTVSLRDELHICEVFLDIEHIRLEERLLLEINIEDGCDYIEVPPMSLLTLIENAIKHAISPRPEQSLLKVDIKLDNENIVMTVTNPIYKGKHAAAGTGTGLSNLLTRMQLMYGEKASLCATQDDEHYCATLVLPVSEA